MIEESGKVVAVEHDKVWVETIRQSTCGGCAAQKGCGHHVLEKMDEGRRNRVLVFSEIKVGVGDDVLIGIPEDVVLKGSVLLYLMPIALLVLGMWLAGLMYPFSGAYHDMWSLVGGICGLGLGLVLNRLHSNFNRNNRNYQPFVINRIASTQTAGQLLHCSNL